MANIENLAPFILSFEGGFVNDPSDRGGATNQGVTLTTWRSVGYDKDGDDDIDVDDLRLITPYDVIDKVLRPHYWDKCKADQIEDQSVANMLVDWAYNSGVGTAAKAIQRIVGCTADGIIGKVTLAAINKREPRSLFDDLKTARRLFIDRIIEARPEQEKYRHGWMRRINSIEYGKITLNNGTEVWV